MTTIEVKQIYDDTRSMRLTAKITGIPLHKIRDLKKVMGWPTLKPRGKPSKDWRARGEGMSIYDMVETSY